VTVVELDKPPAEGVVRCEGMRERRGTRGDLRATSTRMSRGEVGIGVDGLMELSDTSSISVDLFPVCGEEDAGGGGG